MTNNNNLESSIIPISSTSLDRVENSIMLTNKIITKYSIRLVPFRIDNLWYIYNIDSKTIISEGFYFIQFLDNSFTFSKSLFINNKSSFAIIDNPIKLTNIIWYEHLKQLVKDRTKLIAYLDGKSGLIDDNEKLLIQFVYDKIIDKSYLDILIVIQHTKYGIIDVNNYSVILQITYDLIETFWKNSSSEYFLKIKQNNKIGIFDCNKKSLLFLADFVDIDWYNDGICSVKINNNKWALYDYNINKLINKSEYLTTLIFTDGYSICKKEDGFYAVYKNGSEVKLSIDFDPDLIDISDSNTDVVRFNDIFIVDESYGIDEKRFNSYATESIHRFHIYYKLQLQSIINYKASYRFCRVHVKNKIIEINQLGKYDILTTKNYYNINGEEISEKNITDLKSTENLQNGKTQYLFEKVSNWKIVEKKLFFKNELVYDNIYYTLEADFKLDFPELISVIDDDCQGMIFKECIGYIDHYGNIFWQNNSEII